MNPFPADANILLALRLLRNAGYEAYIVGGSVRDYVLDCPSMDYDIAASATLEEAEELFSEYKTKKYIGKGITLGVVINHTHFELSTFKGDSIQEDLKNRDFSMNSMAWSPETDVLDPYSGIYDMSSSVLRCVREPRAVLTEDPARILRAIRFYATKGMKPDKALSDAIHECRYLLKDLKRERVRKELDAILLSEKPSIYFREYADVFSVLLPKLGECVGFDQKNKYWHCYDVYEHTLKVVDSTKPILELRMAALLHDIGKPDSFTMDENGVGHFYGHPVKSLEYADEILVKYCYNHVFIERVERLIEFHDYDLQNTDKALEHFLYRFGTRDLDLYFGLRRADILGQNPKRFERLYLMDELADHVKAILDSGRIMTLKNLRIKGHELLELGYQDEEIGKALQLILTKVIHKELKNDPDKLYNYAAELRYHLEDLEK